MTRPEVPKILPAIIGALHQERANGTLILEHNDGRRRLYWNRGNLTFLQSDVAGEQFGNYLLRQGVLDYESLSELLANDEKFRLGEKIVQWGLLSQTECDNYLCSLQEQVMVHALEHPIQSLEWKSGEVSSQLSADLRFEISHRQFVWSTFQEAHHEEILCKLLYEKPDWRWVGPANLIDTLGDLPLTPKVAYALSFLGPEPVGFETFISLSHGLEEREAATVLMTLWALGALTLSQGELPSLAPTKVETPPFMPPPPPKPVSPPAPPPILATSHSAPPVPVVLEVVNEDAEQVPQSLKFVPLELDVRPPSSPPTVIALEEPVERHEDAAPRARKLFLHARNLLIQDRIAEAIRFLEESVKLDPDSDLAYETWLQLGKSRLTNPAWANRAIDALQAASRLRPKTGEPWALMGEVYYRKGFKANAYACFKKALSLDPSVPIPPDISLRDMEAAEAPLPTSMLDRFKAILGVNRDRG